MLKLFKQLISGDQSAAKRGEDVSLRSISDKIFRRGPSITKSKYAVSSCQSTGLERIHNEDTIFTLTSVFDSAEVPVTFGIFLVADGMGGHKSGEVASSLAAQSASQFLIDKVFNNVVFGKNNFSDADLKKLVGDAVNAAQKTIRQQVPGGGTTLTLVLAVGDRLFSAHVGDSRLYLIEQDGKMRLKTKDHSLVKRLVDLGEITEREASVHPQRNVLYRALGQIDPFEPDVDQFKLKVGESFLICSDGLWGVLKTHQIEAVIESSKDFYQSTCNLVQSANESGGPDNISVVLVERKV